MPQLDPSSYPSQIFWLIVCFFSMMFIMSKFIIPKIADILEQRRKQIDSSLDQAEKFKGQAETAMLKYQKAIDEATAQAGISLNQAQEDLKKFIEEKNSEISKKLSEQISQGEKQITLSKEQALKEMQGNIKGLSKVILDKIGITSISAKDIDEVIKKVS